MAATLLMNCCTFLDLFLFFKPNVLSSTIFFVFLSCTLPLGGMAADKGGRGQVEAHSQSSDRKDSATVGEGGGGIRWDETRREQRAAAAGWEEVTATHPPDAQLQPTTSMCDTTRGSSGQEVGWEDDVGGETETERVRSDGRQVSDE